MVHRSSGQFTQAQATALGASYNEVMHNLEVAKINLQTETPLYSIIDEPELPLPAQQLDIVRYTVIWAILEILLAEVFLAAVSFYNMLKPALFKYAK